MKQYSDMSPTEQAHIRDTEVCCIECGSYLGQEGNFDVIPDRCDECEAFGLKETR